ncbi:MAG: CheY-like chemotaxis protein/HPt (histidine-containing phosphotransfer) domain-containing protein [Alteromonadaceae bacterium]|jgi:CheY-like chemotaxis protein/HPt (histidine-containing phosphotransfer) domain-containing protein
MDMNNSSILLVDDEKANLKVLSSLLRNNVNIQLATSGQEAINKAETFLPDLILLDVVMPEMDGFETIKALKANPLTEHIPVIFITGLNSADKEELGLTLGAVDYIYKPFNQEVVKARVRTQLKIVRQRIELQALSAELSKASQIKSRFLANMSHEIRTPLTAVIGYAESILAGEIAEKEQFNAVEIINNSGQHLLSLINDILDLSKIEADKLIIEQQPVAFFKLMKDVSSLMEHKAKSKGLDFCLDYHFPLPAMIVTDPTRLKQIIINLVGNAIKFTESGFVRIAISIDGAQLIIAVEDSGIGISQHNIENLFCAFEQVAKNTTSKFGGTGLGLNISKYLTQELAGDLTVNSEIDEGSCFIATVALVPVWQCQWLNSTSEVALLTEFKRHQQILNYALVGHVLLAEDNNDIRQLITVLLEKIGLTVSTVSDGQQLVNKARTEKFDLIISDIHMPRMGGVEALQRLKRSGCCVPFIALTANVMKEDIASYLSAGFDGYLAKPIERDKFVQVISRLLKVDLGKNDLLDQNLEVPQGVLNELQQQFVAGLPKNVDELKLAYQRQDSEQLQFFVHRLNGAAAIFKFEQIRNAASTLENRLVRGNILDEKDLINQLIEKLCNTISDAIIIHL